MNKRKLIPAAVVVGAAILVLGGGWILSKDRALNIPTAAVQRGSLDIRITEVGELKAKDQVTISAPTDKQILYLAPEGSWVEEGELLVRFESEKYKIYREEAESSLAAAKANLEKAQRDLEAQMHKEEAAKKEYESQKQLADRGYAVGSEVDQAYLRWQEFQSTTGSYRAEVDARKADVDRAESAVQTQVRKLNQGEVYAPRAGLVVYAYVGKPEEGQKVEIGMIPFEGQNIMFLPDISTMLVDTEISEVDLSEVKVGQEAEIRPDAYPDTIFKGKVAKISNLARRKVSKVTGKATGSKVFGVTIEVLETDRRLKPGLTATVDIKVAHLNEVLYVPVEAIFMEDDKPFAYVKQNNKVRKAEVKIGQSTEDFVVVEEGLSEGQHILLGRPS